jgi:hypothetical protein
MHVNERRRDYCKLNDGPGEIVASPVTLTLKTGYSYP